jgi:hypothetical protein
MLSPFVIAIPTEIIGELAGALNFLALLQEGIRGSKSEAWGAFADPAITIARSLSDTFSGIRPKSRPSSRAPSPAAAASGKPHEGALSITRGKTPGSRDAISLQVLAFFEAYFSNYIEDTTFRVAKAARVVRQIASVAQPCRAGGMSRAKHCYVVSVFMTR